VRTFRADLHLHTCLSPCAGYDVSPWAVVKRAADLRLDLIAICDHNSAENVAAALDAARRLGDRAPCVLPGLEVTSAEEVHLLTIFEGLSSALTMQAMVYDHLQEGENDPALFGDQIVVNVDDEVEEFNTKLLIGSTDLTVESVVERAHSLGGRVIAAHVDRQAFSLVGQLGMIPPGLDLDAVELSKRTEPQEAARWVGDTGMAVLVSSDAHSLDQVGVVWSEIMAVEPNWEEFCLALKSKDSRLVAGWGKRQEDQLN
jgi:predicted metal-dependent phosphoesterase TrpH